jgi:hypothetical protein
LMSAANTSRLSVHNPALQRRRHADRQGPPLPSPPRNNARQRWHTWSGQS